MKPGTSGVGCEAEGESDPKDNFLDLLYGFIHMYFFPTFS